MLSIPDHCRSRDRVKNRFYVHEVYTDDEIKKLGSQQTDPTSADADRKYGNASEFYRTIIAKVMNVKPDFEEIVKKDSGDAEKGMRKYSIGGE